MTRDEAINKAIAIRAPYGNRDAGFRELIARDIDVFITLGMLKLDEPKRFSNAIVDIVRELRCTYDDTIKFLEQLELRGLKIVEK